jgi:hypothetical protein
LGIQAVKEKPRFGGDFLSVDLTCRMATRTILPDPGRPVPASIDKGDHQMPTTRRSTVVLAVLATSMLLSFRAEAGRVDPPGHQDANHCVSTFGVDLNDLYGVSEQIRMRECRAISAGEHWIRPLF